MSKKKKDAVGYIRVSREERDVENLGPHAQRAAIQAYCEAHGLNLRFVYQDVGVSGAKLLADRPEGSELVAAMKTAPAVLVAAKQDRLFRSIRDAIAQMEEFRRLGVETVCIADGFDLTQPSGRLMFNVMAAMNEYEREMIGVRTKEGLSVKRNRGERISPHAPYGYHFVDSGKKTKKGRPIKLLAPLHSEQENLTQMAAMLDQGYSYRRVAQWLLSREIKMRDGRRWSAATVKKVVSQYRKRRSAESDTGPTETDQGDGGGDPSHEPNGGDQ